MNKLAQARILAARRVHEAGKSSSSTTRYSPPLARAIMVRRRAVASGVSGRAWVLSSASFATRSGACRMISKAI